MWPHSPFHKKKPKSSVEIVLKKKIECLILIGDAVLDNFYGLEDNEHYKDIEYQIVDTLNKCKYKGKDKDKDKDKDKKNNKNKKNKSNANAEDSKNADDDNKQNGYQRHIFGDNLIKIHNLSLDEIDTDGILNGIIPDEIYVKARKTYKLPAYPLDKDNKLYPIKLLSSMVMNKEIKIIQKNKDKNHINPTVILSVGFGDLRKNLKYGKPELIIEALRKDSFQEKYEKIVHQMVDNLGLNLIIIIAYEPHESFTEKQLHFSRDDLLSCLEFVGTKIMQIGEKYKCPIIDLSRTLNPFNIKHYGSTAIEPSMLSGQYVVDLIIKILSIWDWNDEKRKSKIYYGLKIEHGIQTVDNDKSLRSEYFNLLQRRALTLNTASINDTEMGLLDDLFGGNNNDNNKTKK